MEKENYFKMKDDFFDNPVIKKLRKIAGGATYVIIYQKILVLSAKNQGSLIFERNVIKELAADIDEKEINVAKTIEFMKENRLIEVEDYKDTYLNFTEIRLKEGKNE